MDADVIDATPSSSASAVPAFATASIVPNDEQMNLAAPEHKRQGQANNESNNQPSGEDEV